MNTYLSALIIIAVLGLCSVTAYLPLILIFKDAKMAQKFTVPVSISAQILFGYIFYNLNIIKYYPAAWLILVFVVNVYASFVLEIKMKDIVARIKRWKPRQVGWVVAILIPLLYSRCYDAYNFMYPGANDTFGHYVLLDSLRTLGRLSTGYYAPGFHIFLFPLFHFVSITEIFRYAGPAIGLIFLLSVYLLLRDTFKHQIMMILLLLLLACPIYNQLTLQTISFFSSVLSFMLFVPLLYLIYSVKTVGFLRSVALGLWFSAALAITVPYFFVQYIPALLVATLLGFIFKRRWNHDYFKYLVTFVAIAAIGLLLSFGHVYLQATVLSRYGGFPNVAVSSTTSDGQIVLESNQAPNTFTSSPPSISSKPSGFVSSKFYKRYIAPAIRTGKDWVKIKNIRPMNNILSVGAYLWMILSLGLLIYALIKKRLPLFIISIFCLVLGFSTQTGVFELMLYRGRSGWYLLLLSILGLTYAFDEFYRQKFRIALYILLVALWVSPFIYPAHFYRGYYTSGFDESAKIARDFPSSHILLLANDSCRDFTMMSERLAYGKLNDENLKKNYGTDQVFLIFEKQPYPTNPVLAQIAVADAKGLSSFDAKQEKLKQKNEANNQKIKSMEQFGQYQLYYENEDLQFYHLVKK
jgi:hypothetical protein